MGYFAGIALALATWVFARWSGFDRERAFYPCAVIVVASYYVLFATLGGSAYTLVVEAVVMGAFVLAAVLGFKRYPWLVVAGLVGHGVFDAVHDLVVTNPGVPEWWAAFCIAFDVGLGALLAARLLSGGRRTGASVSRHITNGEELVRRALRKALEMDAGAARLRDT